MKFLYQFSAGNSFFHRLDPRSKLIFVICYMIAAFYFPYPWWMFVGVVVLILAVSEDSTEKLLDFYYLYAAPL